MLAMILTSPPHLLQVSISILNTRFSRCAHVIEARFSACWVRIPRESGLGLLAVWVPATPAWIWPLLRFLHPRHTVRPVHKIQRCGPASHLIQAGTDMPFGRPMVKKSLLSMHRAERSESTNWILIPDHF